jgi:type VI secretion system secreted protein Hcp
MKKHLFLSSLLLCATFFFRLNAQDIYLKAMAPPGGDYGGLIKGGSTSDGHQNEIEVLSYSTGMSSCTPSFNGGAGMQACKPSIGSVNFMMPMSGGVDQLKYFMLTGLKLPTADFAFVKAGGDNNFTYYKIHMEDVVVVSVQESGSAGGGVPMVSVELAAPRIAFANYTQNGQSGQTTLSSKIGYNIATNSIWNYGF